MSATETESKSWLSHTQQPHHTSPFAWQSNFAYATKTHAKTYSCTGNQWFLNISELAQARDVQFCAQSLVRMFLRKWWLSVKLFDGPRQPTIVAKLMPRINPAAPPTSDKNWAHSKIKFDWIHPQAVGSATEAPFRLINFLEIILKPASFKMSPKSKSGLQLEFLILRLRY